MSTRLTLKDFASQDVLETLATLECVARNYQDAVIWSSFICTDNPRHHSCYYEKNESGKIVKNDSSILNLSSCTISYSPPLNNNASNKTDLFIVDNFRDDTTLHNNLLTHRVHLLERIKEKAIQPSATAAEIKKHAEDFKFIDNLDVDEFHSKIKTQFDTKVKDLDDAAQKAANKAAAKSKANYTLFRNLVGTKDERAKKPALAGRE